MYNLGRLPGMLPQEGFDGIPTALGGLNAVPQMGGGISPGGIPAGIPQPAQGIRSPVPGGQQPVAQQPSWLQALAPPQGVMPQPAQGAPAIPQQPASAPPSWVSSLMPSQGVMPPSAQGVPQSGGAPGGIPQPAPAQPGQRPSWVSSLMPPGANQAPGVPRRPMQSRWGSPRGRRPGMFGGIRERLY